MLQKSIKNELQLCNAANHIFHCHELKFDEININSRTFFFKFIQRLAKCTTNAEKHKNQRNIFYVYITIAMIYSLIDKQL